MQPVLTHIVFIADCYVLQFTESWRRARQPVLDVILSQAKTVLVSEPTLDLAIKRQRVLACCDSGQISNS